MKDYEVLEKFQQRYMCSQVVFMEWADELGYSTEDAARISAAFGGGLGRGDTCGAVLGAILAISARYGVTDPENAPEAVDALSAKVVEFQQRFAEKTGSTYCRDLIGYDFSKEGERQQARESGVIMQRCPAYVLEALDILDEMM